MANTCIICGKIHVERGHVLLPCGHRGLHKKCWKANPGILSKKPFWPCPQCGKHVTRVR
jgi:predicted RNA-binding Zn-ribbon protein involved in translation (DUF1610 family)